MAKLLMRGGKFLTEGVAWERGTAGKIKLKTDTTIGEVFDVFDTSTADIKWGVEMARADAGGVKGDRVLARDAAEFE